MNPALQIRQTILVELQKRSGFIDMGSNNETLQIFNLQSHFDFKGKWARLN